MDYRKQKFNLCKRCLCLMLKYRLKKMHISDQLTHFSNPLFLDDCWLLSAIASLSVHRFLLKKVMPLEQSFEHGYNGCFTFRVNTVPEYCLCTLHSLEHLLYKHLSFVFKVLRSQFFTLCLKCLLFLFHSLCMKIYETLKYTGFYMALVMWVKVNHMHSH